MKPTKEDCPDKQYHTPCPSGFMSWQEWAEEKEKTHKQIRCTTCGFFAIWIPKDSDLIVDNRGR